MTAVKGVRKSLVLLFIAVLSGAGIFAAFFSFAGLSVVPKPVYRFSAMVPGANQLIGKADVRQAGVRIGKVGAIVRVGSHVRLDLELDERYGPVYENATVLIRGKSLGGERYVDLEPGAPPATALAARDVLPISRAPESTELDQVIAVMKPKRIEAARKVILALGLGIGADAGRDLNELFGATSDGTIDGVPVARILAEQRHALGRVIDASGRITQRLGERGRDLRRLTRVINRLSSGLAGARRELTASLRATPRFMRASRRALDETAALSQAATSFVRDSRIVAQRTIPTLRLLPRASDASRRAVVELRRFAPRGRALVTALRRFAPRAARVLPALEANLRELNPFLAYLAPYAGDLGAGVANTLAAYVNKDGYGNIASTRLLRQDATLEPGFNFAGAAELIDQIYAATGIKELATFQGYNPYPKPGALTLEPWSGRYPRVEADPPYSARRRNRP